MISVRHSTILIRVLFDTAVVCVNLLPYFAARWLVHHDAIYFRLGGSGHFGQFITDCAEMINFLTPIPFSILGLVLGITLASTLRCFRPAQVAVHESPILGR